MGLQLLITINVIHFAFIKINKLTTAENKQLIKIFINYYMNHNQI